MKGVKNYAAKTQRSQKCERGIKNKVPRRYLEGVASRRSQKCDRGVSNEAAGAKSGIKGLRNEAAKTQKSQKCERGIKNNVPATTFARGGEPQEPKV